MKKSISLILAAAMLLCLCLTGCGGKKSLTLNVYNWGEYISDGSEGSFETVREFEKWYEATYDQKVTVNYSTYASNEDMYSKISSRQLRCAHSFRLYDRPDGERGPAPASELRQHPQLSVY